MGHTAYEQTLKKTHTRLKTNALNFWEVSAQAIALISPSMTAALIVPLMFGTAGAAGWLCYLFGTIMLLFVAVSHMPASVPSFITICSVSSPRSKIRWLE